MNSHPIRTLALAACLTASLFAATAHAGVIADFIPGPASPVLPEFIWTGSELISGAGAFGTNFGTAGAGDGQLPESQQAQPGLIVTTPFAIPGLPGSVISGSTTTFYDATLQIIPPGPGPLGLPASGPASIAFGQVIQPLGGGMVRIWSTDPAELAGPDTENPILLLEGVITSATIAGLPGTSTGAVLSASVFYTSGAILQAAGLQGVSGDFSWSLLDILPPLGISGQGTLIPFEANAVGQFSAVPEPASLSLLAVGALTLLRRRA